MHPIGRGNLVHMKKKRISRESRRQGAQVAIWHDRAVDQLTLVRRSAGPLVEVRLGRL